MNQFIRRVYRGVRYRLHILSENCRYCLAYPFALLLKKKRKNIHLFSERGIDARDNGYYMFRYFRTYHPEVDACYVIDKKSADAPKVQELGTVIPYRSWRHYLFFIAAEYKISTHIMGYSPDFPFYMDFNAKHRVPGKQIFLQHGVIQNDHPVLYAQQTKADLFICGAEPEYEYVSSQFQYQNGEVRYTGLARHDGLQQFQTKRQILFMPTWRFYLSSVSDEEFLNSDYYRSWNGLLQNKTLLNELQRQNVQLVFYPHFELQKFLHLFHTDDPHITLADFSHYDVQTLLKESALLVTDYSSVFFDFAYMKKPVLYYQFDETRFHREQYGKGYFDYRTMGFGQVAVTEQQAVSGIVNSMEQDFALSTVYQDRISQFFPLHDAKNCERIFSAIEGLK